LLDTSDSTRARLGEIQDAALAFLDQLRDNDRVLIASFDKQVNLLSEVTNDRRQLREAIRRAQTGGGTALYNTFDVIVNQRMKQIAGRKAIVLFTDGVDVSSASATYDSTLYLAEELDALVFPIQYNTLADVATTKNVESGIQVLTAKGERPSVAYERANRYLRSLSDKTGGRLYYAASVQRLTDVFAAIAQELRHQYSLGYYPSDTGKAERALKVKVDAPNLTVHARKAYRYRSANKPIDERYALGSSWVGRNRGRR